MTAGTGKVGISTWRHISHQAVIMTITTAKATGGHQVAVIRSGRVSSAPDIAVTVCTIATGGEVLGVGAVDSGQAAVAGVTGGTAVMSIRCGAGQRCIAVTAGTTGRCYGDQGGVAWCICSGVVSIPTTAVTTLTVPASKEGLGIRAVGRNQGTSAGVMAARAVSQVG